MFTSVMVTQYLARAILVVQLALGILFWTGHADGLIDVHAVVGLLLVLTLWVSATLGIRRGAPIPIAVLAVLWSIGMVILGGTQAEILPGAAHPVVQVAHLLVGIVAVGLVEALARAGRERETSAV